MGQLNQPTNIIDRVVKLERGLEAIRKMAGLTSAIISRGGLTLLNNSFVKMVTSAGIESMYFGPDSNGKQTFILRRDNGSALFHTGFYAGQPFFALRDQNNAILFSDNAAGGGGMARPWIPVPLKQMFRSRSSDTVVSSSGELFGYHHIANSLIASETVMWQGRVSSILHRFMEVHGTWGPAIGTGTAQYRLKISGTTVGAWTASTLANSKQGPFNVAEFFDRDGQTIQLTCSTSGNSTDATACDLDSVYLRE
ncbi:hypothetical protein [Amycolatopsis sp. H20-H5]|uniref:hypothetical protein n=1 Tax=Amycolatopsis sp. H20-H5 TaxID=3046309 RepID=UPI002DBE7ED2|nr:hypothetical protein [Amycolatopsis sp. H20-H5]MEC3977912.1 hypothetical protein [Amycolatopsis sp. H20-H5]